MISTDDNRKFGATLFAFLIAFANAGYAWGAEPSVYRDATAQTLSALDDIRPLLTAPSGVVVSAKDGAVLIGKESKAAVATGISLKIVREKEPLVHPVTGKKIGSVTEPVGEAVVTRDDGAIIAAVEPDGAGKIKVGDRIETPPAKRKTLLVFEAGTDSPGMASIRSAVTGKVAAFDEASVVSPHAVERFLSDHNLAGTHALVSSAENLKKARQALSADFLIFAGAREKDVAVFIDVELYDLASARQVASFKGLAKAPAGKADAKTADTVAPKPSAQPLPEPVKTPPAAEKPKSLPEPAQTVKPATSLSPVTARIFGSFEGRISAIAAHDLDGDGSSEIILGFDRRLAVYKTSDGMALTLSWEKNLSKRDQITGIHSGDFDGDGKPEIYVNNIVDGAARSMILKERDGGFTPVSEKLRMFFYAGADGRLYGQRQLADLELEDKLVSLEWIGGKLEEKPFIPLPEGARLSGVAIDDIDGDGVMDVIGLDKGKRLVYRSSVKGDWARVDGEYGGSDIAIELPGQGEARVFHEIQPAPIPLKGSGKSKRLFVPHNIQAASFFSSLLLYLQSQFHLLSNEGGLGYAKTFSTPAGDGLVYASAYWGAVDGGYATLGARVETSVLGPGKSELIMFTMDGQ
ncbi:MAG: VCBS repeat-containing protein [Nitrospinae bacterium]|nr:VCBS repeat-containing protein [Nitrospinota bacterium]MBF0633951.1 VCBS repeat-containing protein [Nitrospinota bacterium]